MKTKILIYLIAVLFLSILGSIASFSMDLISLQNNQNGVFIWFKKDLNSVFTISPFVFLILLPLLFEKYKRILNWIINIILGLLIVFSSIVLIYSVTGGRGDSNFVAAFLMGFIPLCIIILVFRGVISYLSDRLLKRYSTEKGIKKLTKTLYLLSFIFLVIPFYQFARSRSLQFHALKRNEQQLMYRKEEQVLIARRNSVWYRNNVIPLKESIEVRKKTINLLSCCCFPKYISK